MTYNTLRSWINGYTRLLNFRKNPLYPLLFESARLLKFEKKNPLPVHLSLPVYVILNFLDANLDKLLNKNQEKLLHGMW